MQKTLVCKSLIFKAARLSRILTEFASRPNGGQLGLIRPEKNYSRIMAERNGN